MYRARPEPTEGATPPAILSGARDDRGLTREVDVLMLSRVMPGEYPSRRPGAWYALRRTLPPWRTDTLVAEVEKFCRDARVDELIVKVDTEEFSHGFPSPSWLDAYLPQLREIRDRMRRLGVVFSLNPWVTLGHVDRGRNVRQRYPEVDLMVGHDGTPCRDCACPLSPGWRRLTAALWERYAALEPTVLWVEDDFRLHHHPPVRWGCFCPLHLKAFALRLARRRVTREELVKRVLTSGPPDPFRKAWLDFQRDVMVETARFLERTVHRVSPGTRLGLMSSHPDAHAVEGRDWGRLSRALAGPGPLVSRPAMFCYSGDSPTMLYEGAHCVRLTLAHLPRRRVVLTEIDNGPFGPYSKSLALTRLQAALSFVLGADGLTLNLFDHLGTPAATPEWEELLRREKPVWEALAQACHGTCAAGVGLIHRPDAARHLRLAPGQGFDGLLPGGDGWRRVLEPLGVAVTVGAAAVTVVTGQMLRALPASEIRRLLKRGLLLDLSAAQCLAEMGWASFLGCRIRRTFRKCDEALSAEEWFAPDFGGAAQRYLTLSLLDAEGTFQMAELEPAPNARILSRVVDPDGRPRYPLLVASTHSLGGRVAVYGASLEPFLGVGFLSAMRREQMIRLLDWLSCGRVPMVVGGGPYPLAFRRDARDRSLLGWANLSLDDWRRAEIRITTNRRPASIAILTSRGSWASAGPGSSLSVVQEGRYLRMRLSQRIRALSVVAVAIRWAEPRTREGRG